MTSLPPDATKSEPTSPDGTTVSGRKKSQRPSWSCTECTRRKIRCDRVVPGCNQCVKRNKVHLCRLEQDEKIGFGPDRPDGMSYEPARQPRLASTSEFEAITRNINVIRQSLYHLERVVSAFVPRPDVIDEAGRPSWGVDMSALHAGGSGAHPAADAHHFGAPRLDIRDVYTPVAGPSQTYSLPPVASGSRHSLPPVHEYEPQPHARESSSMTEDDAAVEASVTLEYLALGRDGKSAHFGRAELRRPTAEADELPNAGAADGAAERATNGGVSPAPPSAALDSLAQPPPSTTTSPPHASNIPASVLPTQEVASAIITYSLERVGWQHGAVHSGQFRAECAEFDSWGASRADKVNQAWLALYFAVLCVGVKHMGAEDARSCGLAAEDQRTFAMTYFHVSVEALHRANFLAKHSIYSVQTIVILVVACQDVGGSDLIATLLACGIRIAQHLKISRFGSDEEWEAKRTANGIDPRSEEGIKALIQREVRKRLWYALATEDWLSVPFRRAYAIFPSHFTTPPPLNCHDEDLSSGVLINRPQDEPTCVSKILIAYKVASCIRRFFEDVNSKPDYDLLLDVDRKIRSIITEGPTFLKADDQAVEAQPAWVRWMLHWWIMSVSHKLLMCHRVFLGRSFRDAKFAFSRKAAIEAARSIIQALVKGSHLPYQHLWTVPYHTISAATTIILDIFQTSSSDPDLVNKRREVQSALDELRLLANEGNSQIASRGIQLLTTLLAEESKHRCPGVELRKRKAAEMSDGPPPTERERFGEVAKRVVSNSRTALNGASSAPPPPFPSGLMPSPTLATISFPYFAPTLSGPPSFTPGALYAAGQIDTSPRDLHVSDASLTPDAFESILRNLSGWSAVNAGAQAFDDVTSQQQYAAADRTSGSADAFDRGDQTGDFFRMLDAGSFAIVAPSGGLEGGFGTLDGSNPQMVGTPGQPPAVW